MPASIAASQASHASHASAVSSVSRASSARTDRTSRSGRTRSSEVAGHRSSGTSRRRDPDPALSETGFASSHAHSRHGHGHDRRDRDRDRGRDRRDGSGRHDAPKPASGGQREVNLACLVEARREYTGQITHSVADGLTEVVKRLFKRVVKEVQEASRGGQATRGAVVVAFDASVGEVPRWNQDVIDEAVGPVIAANPNLPRLLRMVFVANSMILGSVRVSTDPNAKVPVKVPAPSRFLHQVLKVIAAQLGQGNIRSYINNGALDRQRLRETVEGSVETAIRNCLPIHEILDYTSGVAAEARDVPQATPRALVPPPPDSDPSLDGEITEDKLKTHDLAQDGPDSADEETEGDLHAHSDPYNPRGKDDQSTVKSIRVSKRVARMDPADPSDPLSLSDIPGYAAADNLSSNLPGHLDNPGGPLAEEEEGEDEDW